MKIFISYESLRNQSFVNRLSNSLREIGVSPSIINLKLMYGDKIFDHIDQALVNCDQVIVVLSKAYIKSKWHQKELFAFLMKERDTKTDLILPVRIDDCEVPALLEDRIIDFRRVPFEKAFNKLAGLISKRRQAFVVMKFGDDRLDSAYEVVIKPALEEFRYSVIRIDEVQDSGTITEQILKQISNSEIVFADLTGERPNCYYEAGYAHALQKEIILTVRKD
nr:TIR domain-containing protein [Acidobacteriota bacterium]